MANLKSAKKQARQNIKRHKKNIARKSAIKTAIKKVLAAIATNESVEKTTLCLRDVEAQLARARGKNVFQANTVRRKISRLAKKVSQVTRAAGENNL